MKVIEEIETRYLPLVKKFLPSRLDQVSEIGYQIEMFLSSSDDYYDAKSLRLREENDPLSETLYDLVKMQDTKVEQIDDLYLPVEGNPIYFGFNI
jgi:hypothetical protein